MSDRTYAKVQAQQKTLSGSSPRSSLLQRTCACGQHTIAGAQCSTCRSEQSTLHRSQRAFEPPSAPGAVPGSSPAQENGTSFNSAFDRASRFGHDFSRIPIHPPAAGALQTKLAINQPGDHYEQEADRISEQVMRTPEPQLQRACACGGACPKCQTEQLDQEHDRVQAKRVGSGDLGQTAAPPIVHEVLRSPGQPLDPATRAFMEPRFGHDFSHVRVHADESAEMSARTINAHAYTVGNDIVFGHGRFDFNGTEGRRLIAHELTHVVQQSAEHASGAAAQQLAGAGVLQRKDDPKASPKAPTCDTGCAQRWGQDTTCSKWGMIEPSPWAAIEPPWAVDPHQEPLICCNAWPLSLEVSARQGGLNGVASCTADHEREVATVTFEKKSVNVLCTDTIPRAQFKPKPISPAACTDAVMDKEKVGGKKVEVLEMSPAAMIDLSGRLDRALPVSVCYSGVKADDLCPHTGPLPEKPKIEQCLSEGCRKPEDPPTHDKSGWPEDRRRHFHRLAAPDRQ